MEDEDIDIETLQARIDMSMSYAQELVSSWVQPSAKPTVTNIPKNTERELQEYLRRPPRLGVGAPTPESSGLSRETARLKNHLTGKSSIKRLREENGDDERLSSEDEEESRAGAIKQKARADVFSASGETKRQKQKKIETNDTSIGQSHPPEDNKQQAIEGNDVRLPGLAEAQVSPIETSSSPAESSKSLSKKKKRRRGRPLLHDGSPLDDPNSLSLLERRARECSDAAILPESSGSSMSKVIYGGTLYPDKLPAEQLSLAVSVVASPDRSPLRSQMSPMSAAFKIPLLNLDGPPPDLKDEALSVFQEGSPKRKRRRRKHKKSILHTDIKVGTVQ